MRHIRLQGVDRRPTAFLDDDDSMDDGEYNCKAIKEAFGFNEDGEQIGRPTAMRVVEDEADVDDKEDIEFIEDDAASVDGQRTVGWP